MFLPLFEYLAYNTTKQSKKVKKWQRKKHSLSVNHVDFNLQDGWGSVPLATNGKV